VIEAKKWCDARPRSPGTLFSRDGQLGVGESLRKTVMSIGTGSRVEIAAKQDWRMALDIPEPVGTKKRG